MTEIARIAAALSREPAQPAVLATLVRVAGSSYRRPGARLLLLADGTRLGSISGGCLEEDVLQRAQQVLAAGRPEVADYDTTNENDLVWGVGTGCKGAVRIFLEPIAAVRPPWIATLRENLAARRETELAVVYGGRTPGTFLASGPTPGKADVFCETISAPPALVVFGAGDDVQPLVRLATETGWQVTVADPRTGFATRERFPAATRILTAPAEKLVESAAPDERTFVVVMTHRFAEDVQLLRDLFPRPLAYLGLLGTRARSERLLERLAADGFTPDEAMRERFHAPVGLDLGGATPETVALSILAEMQSRLTQRIPINLRDRLAPIHG